MVNGQINMVNSNQYQLKSYWKSVDVVDIRESNLVNYLYQPVVIVFVEYFEVNHYSLVYLEVEIRNRFK